MVKPILFFVLVLIVLKSNAQSENTSNYKWGAMIGYKYQETNFIELGLVCSKMGKGSGYFNDGILSQKNIGVGLDINLSNFLIGPKLSYEINYVFIAARANITTYTDFKKTDIRFTPEIGITLFGLLNIYYGYNLALSDFQFNEIGNHRIGVHINIIPFLYREWSK